jgi:hypothetical protein
LEQAQQAQPEQPQADSSSNETQGQASSALTATRPSQSPQEVAATTDHAEIDATVASSAKTARRAIKLWTFSAVALTLLLIACGVIIIKIKDKSGRVIGTIKVPEGGSFEVTEESPPSDATTTAILPDEPPPLVEWLKTRTKIITVAKDGSGDFDTIQAAIKALQPHEAVRVLDKGPYKETLYRAHVPEDTGLVTTVGTVVQSDQWSANGPNERIHGFDHFDGFRLHGFRFVTSAAPSDLSRYQQAVGGTWAAAFYVAQARGLVVEHCSFQCPSPRNRPIRCALFSLHDLPNGKRGQSFVRDCVFSGQCVVASEGDAAIVRRCLFRNTGSTALILNVNECGPIEMSQNVFDPSCSRGVDLHLFGELTVDIRKNTLLNSGASLEVSTPNLLNDVVEFEQNIFAGPVKFLKLSDAQAKETLAGWDVQNNAHLADEGALKPAFSDDIFDANAADAFLSLDSHTNNFVRPKPTGPFNLPSTDGEVPTYIGALPPGPTPLEGDWLTRLQQVSATVDFSYNEIEEPPPLEEWLKGREIVTVAKDGSGDFETIQAALDTLKPGQVVKVLDRGPYQEQLSFVDQINTGLVSEVGTVVSPTAWKPDPTHRDLHLHTLTNATGVRISGFAFVEPPLPVDADRATCIVGHNSSSIVIEGCWFDSRDLANSLPHLKGVVTLIGLRESAEQPDPAVTVRECRVKGRLFFESADEDVRLLIERNVFEGYAGHAVAINGRFVSSLVRHNFFGDGRMVWTLSIESLPTVGIINNTFFGGSQVADFDTDPSKIKLMFQNNICSRPAQVGAKLEAEIPDEVSNWRISHNSYWPDEPSSKSLPFGHAAVRERAKFLAAEPGRIELNSQHASAGVGVSLPTYIGALPPGPAPPEGDWFTRLQERWKDVLEESPKARDKSPENRP